MYYAVTFTRGGVSKNTWTDWYMVPSSRPVIAPPKPKTTVVEIPGSSSVIDLSEFLTGDISYENRKGTIEFVVMNEKPISWFELYSQILDFLHGRIVQVQLEEEPEYYYEGRCDVEEWSSESDYSRISINYDLYPFKYQSTATEETIDLTGTDVAKTYTVGRMPVVPKFVVSGTDPEVSVTFKGTSHNLPTGESAVAGVVFEEGSNSVTFSGTGTVKIIYRGGRL